MRILLPLLALLAAVAVHVSAAGPTITARSEGYECGTYGCRLFLPYYSPLLLTVPAGATVTFVNGDTGYPGPSREHTATASLGGFDSGLVAPGGSTTFTAPTVPGDHPYHCIRHPVQMHAVLRVTP